MKKVFIDILVLVFSLLIILASLYVWLIEIPKEFQKPTFEEASKHWTEDDWKEYEDRYDPSLPLRYQ